MPLRNALTLAGDSTGIVPTPPFLTLPKVQHGASQNTPHKTRLIPSGVLGSGDSDQHSRCFLKLISLMLTSQPAFSSSSIALIVLTDWGSRCHHRGHNMTQENEITDASQERWWTLDRVAGEASLGRRTE